ncbi:uncharacterized protein Z520_06631 [Fonsecaea multimorphosa CBS 102226]|uniref:CFEM domain-containing protein n=1 Tax=Fonsecaea multimorphosa CBS 102226 TaxID=1442371 RepID=A0A0D2KMF2_9EURO|nr:uncharacterized protein Z520_06631 [Fonsecaea multimorphosa CBS 102226]KIX97853.1 hypothetical protein Z520_06631 [Fonsecaea multimorphosa CBS 102226]
MAFKLSILLCSLSLIVSPFVNAIYDSWTELPYCAQYCFTTAVNNSLAACADVPIDCFCRSTDPATNFNLCLQANVPCNTNPFNNDVEVFKNTVFCNASVNSGFYYMAGPGAATVTLGIAPGGNLSATIFSSFASSISPDMSVNPTNTSTKCTDFDSVTTPAVLGLMTSTSTVIVELSSTASSSSDLNGTWTATSIPTVIAAQASNIAARAHADIWEFARLGTSCFVTWILVGKILY